ncbi:alpha/beta hydrolase family esterase [Aquihabitans sp. McL0605]|uniref:alpha/beta hydrolase family esterase n=1 Tax=Aquihabitans sp. McL0605 TaxID=3415671 RepID=UPI003CED7B01
MRSHPSSSPRRRGALLAIGVALALAATACSGSSAGSDGTSATTSGATTSGATTSGGAAGQASTTTAAVVATPGCGKRADVAAIGAQAPGDVVQTLPSGGVDRSYRLAVPTGYDPAEPAPLVLNLHGSGSNALQASIYGDVPRQATGRGMIVATPDAVDGKWQIAPAGADADFLDALVTDLESRYCIDQDRVDIMGISLGAWKAAVTACSSGDRYAAAVLVAVEVHPNDCRPLPVMAFHGTADPVVPYGDGADPGVVVTGSNRGLPGALFNIAGWAKGGGCDPEPEITTIGDDVVLRRFHGCDPGVGVELYTVKGGGHTWPGAAIKIGGDPKLTTETIDATDLALDWFEAHPRRS